LWGNRGREKEVKINSRKVIVAGLLRKEFDESVGEERY
jgi:hypothetical protein